MTAETPTPLTDAREIQFGDGPAKYVYAAHHAELETRCAELERERAEVMLSDQGRLRSKLASYEGQIAELKRDRERLD